MSNVARESLLREHQPSAEQRRQWERYSDYGAAVTGIWAIRCVVDEEEWPCRVARALTAPSTTEEEETRANDDDLPEWIDG